MARGPGAGGIDRPSPEALSCASPSPGLERLFSRAQGRTLIILARLSLGRKLPPCCLGIEEQIREKRFRHPADRERFRAAHFIKRMGCAAALGLDPASLSFDAQAGGKPELRNFPALFFSLSHNGGWVGAAFAQSGPLGFDVQRPVLQARLIKSLFPDSPARNDVTPQGFALRWAMLEAACKQDGSGLSWPLPGLWLEKTESPRVARLELRGKTLFVWHALLGDGSALALASASLAAVADPALAFIG